MTALIFVGLLALVVIGFFLLDRWHKRRAWREAEKWARRQVARRDGRRPPL